MDNPIELLKEVLDYAEGKGKFAFTLAENEIERERMFFYAWKELKEKIEKYITDNEVEEFIIVD